MTAMTSNSQPVRRVLLIGWDGADWKMINPLIEQGLMPAMKRFTEEGVMGNIASLTPMLSPILWTSIATGKHADKHQILGFCEPNGSTGEIRPVTSTSRRCAALWNILSQRGLHSIVVNWFASHPAEAIKGCIVSDRFAVPCGPNPSDWSPAPNSVHPPELFDELAAQRVHPACTTPQQVAPFIPSLSDVDPVKDENLHQLRMMLAHCATSHAAATHLMQTQAWDFCAIYYDAIDRCGHAFMEYHPPKMSHISDRDFQLYRDVMVGVYRFHDMMLARLMEIAGDDTTVIIVSDHGFHCDELRPKFSGKIKEGRPVAWHRPYGVLAMHGPNIKKDERIYGATLLDIAPTVLAMLGLPIAQDMDGVSLKQAFVESKGCEGGPSPVQSSPESITTYEAAAADTTSAPATEEDPWAAAQVLQQLKGLGYLADDSVDGVVLDRMRNLGQVYAATGRPQLAIDEFQKVLKRKPDDNGAKMAMASAHLSMGNIDECERLAREVLAENLDGPEANLYLGMIAFRRGQAGAALEHLQRAENTDPRMSGLHVQIGEVYLRQQRWEDGERAFRRALQIDSDSAEAHDGLGVCLRQQRQPAEAVYHHMQAVSLLHHRPQSHINLGMALADTGRIDWAIRAFMVASEMAPQHPFPHHCLAQIYERAKRDPEKAAFHSQKANELRQRLRPSSVEGGG